jgi:hypothetical protein
VEQTREADALRAYDDPQWAATARCLRWHRLWNAVSENATSRLSIAVQSKHDRGAPATCRGCVFETVGGQHVDEAAFRGLRRHCVLGGSSAAACELLFGAAMQQLVHAALGAPGVLFNDQVGHSAKHATHTGLWTLA